MPRIKICVIRQNPLNPLITLVKKKETKKIKKASEKKPSKKKKVLVKKKREPVSAKSDLATAGKEKKIVVEKKVIKPVLKEEKKATPKKLLLPKPPRYWEAVGRRKTSIARVRLFTKGEKKFLINDKDFKIYFPSLELQEIITSPFKKMKCLDRFGVSVRVKGGGYHSQAEAIRHGASRALVKFNSDFQKRLRRAGFLTRDSRMKERKKFGLKRARRAPQWSKR